MDKQGRQSNDQETMIQKKYLSKNPKFRRDLSVDSLKYLDIDQALEDLAHFIRIKKTQIDGAQNSGVILIGASYSATMVSWFRQRYPDLVNGVWASSAPLYAQVDFFEYKEVAGRSLDIVMGNEQCSQRINRAFVAMETAIDNGQFAKLENAFNTCTKGVTPSNLDVWRFFDGVSEMIAGHVQTHYIRSTTIQDACIKILDATVTDDIEAFAAWFRDVMGDDCFDHTYAGMIDYFTQTSWTSQVALDSCK
jgi:Serine carboxypeptidase S28